MALVGPEYLRSRRIDLADSRTTRREREVMEQLVRGRTNKQMGADLCLSPRNVEIYRGRVLQKMQAETTADLVRLWLTISNDLSA